MAIGISNGVVTVSSDAIAKRGRGRPKKDKWANLPDDFKAAAQRASKEELTALFAEVGESEGQNRKTMNEDEELKDARELVKDLSACYRETTKMNKTKTDFLVGCRDGFPDDSAPREAGADTDADDVDA
jgi:hypothetical protein